MASRFSTLQVEEYIPDVTFCRISAWQTFHLDTFIVPPHPVVEALPQDYFLVVTARHVVVMRPDACFDSVKNTARGFHYV